MVGLADEPVPVVVPDLVAQVPDDRAVLLAELLADQVAVGVVGLGEVERHDATGVTGDRGVVVEADEVEREPVGDVGGSER